MQPIRVHSRAIVSSETRDADPSSLINARTVDREVFGGSAPELEHFPVREHTTET
jgi:hypothetical protein